MSIRILLADDHQLFRDGLRAMLEKEADLEVEVDNGAAQSLYEAVGFRRARVLRDYYGSDRDGLRMVVDVRQAGPLRSVQAGRADRAADGRG